MAGSIRAREPGAIAYSEPSALTSESWVNVCWSISSAPHGAPAMAMPGVACPVEDGVGTARRNRADAGRTCAGAPPDGGGGL